MSYVPHGWDRALIGPLPPRFLRLTSEREMQESADRQAALALYQQQEHAASYVAQNVTGRLTITVSQAKLIKNYGLTRMDPYARIRVGHFVYETQTDPNGGKNPRWNRIINSQLPQGVNTISVEIYDECSFKMDELIAWVDIKIPESVLHGETHEEWYTLSGKQGDFVEGMIFIVMSFVPGGTYGYPGAMLSVPFIPVTSPRLLENNISTLPNVAGRTVPVFVSPQPIQQPPIEQLPPVQPITDEDVKQIEEMFPNIDVEVIRSVFEVNRGNKQVTINALLQMSDQ